MENDRLLQNFIKAAQEYQSLTPSTVSVIDGPPTPLQFSKLVASNRPVLFNDFASNWVAFEQWQSDQYLISKCGSKQITVAVTPNGLADAVIPTNPPLFALPHEISLTFTDFIKRLTNVDSNLKPNDVVYIQSQNNNLNHEFKELLDDLPKNAVQFAEEVFESPPDAVNFWMGNSKSVTSTHKDHYENIYVVLRGSKTFTLIPPIEQFTLHTQPYLTAIYTPPSTLDSSASWTLTPLHPKTYTPWIALDPTLPWTHPKNRPYPYFKYARPIQITVNAGQALYLPSMWYHHVRMNPSSSLSSMNDSVIAVNWWFDMEFGDRWAWSILGKSIDKSNEDLSNDLKKKEQLNEENDENEL